MSSPRLTKGVELHPWQHSALHSWLERGRGTVKVVTGAGKTVLGLAAIERLWEANPELRVAIIVPTVVLMDQWRRELDERSDLESVTIGCAGGGKKASYRRGQRIIIWVLSTASKQLAQDVAEAGVGGNLLLIVDECHRAGAAVMSRIFRTSRRWSLGLSATPERTEDEFQSNTDDGELTVEDDLGETRYSETLLGKQLGPIVYELSLNEAIDLGVLPAFDVHHYGLGLNDLERVQYEALSHSITDARKELQGVFGGARRLIPFARKLAGGSGEMAPVARRFINDAQERKRLLFRAAARPKAVSYLIRNEFTENPDARAILFHESIEQVESLTALLKEELPDYRGKIALEHSHLSDKERSSTIAGFSNGSVQILVSVRSLIEGFNVPAADVGIVVASSTSVRQRVQTLGRLLRRHQIGAGVEKRPRVHVLYIRDTVDDAIYGMEDWGKSTGYERNRYFRFLPPDEPIQQVAPPRVPMPGELELDASSLTEGAVYSGRYEGKEYTLDTRHNIKDLDGNLVFAPSGLWKTILGVKGGAGRFAVTPKRKYVLIRALDGESWVTRYVTRWPAESPDSLPDTAGYAGPIDKVGGEYMVKERGGRRVVSWEVRVHNSKEEYYLSPEGDDPRREDVARILTAVEQLERKGITLRRFQVNSKNDAIGAFEGHWELLVPVVGPLWNEERASETRTADGGSR